MVNSKYAFVGFDSTHPNERFVLWRKLYPFDTEHDCVYAARLWAKVYAGTALCYCVQDGVIGGRPITGFYGHR